MQVLRDILENCKMVDITDEQKSIFSSIIYQIDIFLLEKEKKQMIDFAMQMHKIDCSKTGTDLLFDEAESYYNQTFNQNK